LQRAALNDLMTALLRKFSAAQACTDRQLAVQTDSYVAAESGPSCLCLYDAGWVPTILGQRHGSKWLDAFPCGPMLSYVLQCGPT